MFRDYEYENSIKVPFIVSHPGQIPEGRVETAMVSAYDLMPTLLDTLGLPIPSAERNLPGQSFAPLLRGEPSDGHQCVVIYCWKDRDAHMMLASTCENASKVQYLRHTYQDSLRRPLWA